MSSAELYDPATGFGHGLWRRTSSLNVPRALRTAPRLADGSVLVVGELGGSDETPALAARLLDSAEIYRQVRTAGRPRHR